MSKIKYITPWIYSILSFFSYSFFFFGGMIFTMMTQYPNWDNNLPDLMVRRNQFYAQTDPGTFVNFLDQLSTWCLLE